MDHNQQTPDASGPQFRHVNLMVDVIITNTPSDDLRTILRGLFVVSPQSVTDAFCKLAKAHLDHTTPYSASTIASAHATATSTVPPQSASSSAPVPQQPHLVSTVRLAKDLFTPAPELQPTPAFESTLARARARYGAGLAGASIQVLMPIVDLVAYGPDGGQQTQDESAPFKWEEGSAIEDALGIVDCDISAAILRAKDELKSLPPVPASALARSRLGSDSIPANDLLPTSSAPPDESTEIPSLQLTDAVEGTREQDEVPPEVIRQLRTQQVLQDLKEKLEKVEAVVSSWGGDNPFERSLDALLLDE